MSTTKTLAAQDPNTSADPQLPLRNLTQIRTRIDSLRCLLSDSINSNAPLTDHQTAAVSDQIAAAIHHTIANAAALLSFSRTFDPPDSAAPPPKIPPRVDLSSSSFAAAENARRAPDLKIEAPDDDAPDDCGAAAADDSANGVDDEIVELDAVELLAEHIHFCEICGKGFRRDANLRMHMRAHGNQFKTPEALAKPEPASAAAAAAVRRRFSCPFEGCNRNRHHRRFRPLKSIVCVKNHFKRSHCPKMYSCNRCHKKNFSVLSDLKSHMKHCGESKWRCSCGTTFSRKDKLFGHIALFEGHMPALPADEEEKGKQVVAEEEEDEDAAVVVESDLGGFLLDDTELPDGFFDDLDDLSSLGLPLI